jgi:molybdopterin-binding protein
MGHTRRALRNALALLLVALIYQQTCLAQVDPWERVKLIEPGKNVHVKLQSGKTVKGKMEAWSADGLTVRQGKQKVAAVAKSDVAQVALVIGKSRGRKAMWAGLITGSAVGGFLGALCHLLGCSAEGALYGVVPISAGSAGVAAGIAALFPPHKEVLYTAAPSTPGTRAPRK